MAYVLVAHMLLTLGETRRLLTFYLLAEEAGASPCLRAVCGFRAIVGGARRVLLFLLMAYAV